MAESSVACDTAIAIETRLMSHTPPPHPARPWAIRPTALLLDFGGVIFLTRKHADGRHAVAGMLQERLLRAGHEVEVEALERSLNAGLAALKDWKNAAGRRRTPRELTPREIWHDFLAADLGDAERRVLAGDAAELLHAMTGLLSIHEVRAGIPRLLTTAAELGIRVGIVSNAHSGRSHRELLAHHGLDRFVHVQVYSDEVGIRKPHPDMIHQAAAALGTDASHVWYVGDTHDRDLVAGRRAGVAAVILTRSQHTDHSPYPVGFTPDAVLDDPDAIADMLLLARPASVGEAAVVGSSELTDDASEPATWPSVEALPVSRPRALLLDHGGVISASTKDPDAQRRFAVKVAARLRAAGHSVTDEDLVAAIAEARLRHRARKAEEDACGGHREITPHEYWHDLVGRDCDPGVRAWLAAEASELSHSFALIKSRVRLRPGVPDLFATAKEQGIRIAIVSNTLSGRAVRDRLRNYGLLDGVAVSVYSDELGLRKPASAMPLEALGALGIPASDVWFVGDKPDRDMIAAHTAGVPVAVLVRGGSTSDDDVDRVSVLDDGVLRPDLVVPSLTHLSDILRRTSDLESPASPTSTPHERALP